MPASTDKIISAFKVVVDKAAQTGDQLALDALRVYEKEMANYQKQTGAIIKITDGREHSVNIELIVVPMNNIPIEKPTFAQYFGYRVYNALNRMLKQGPTGPLAKALLGTSGKFAVENKECPTLSYRSIVTSRGDN